MIARSRRKRWVVASLLSLSTLSVAASENWTKIHEAGRCAIRGQCGKEGWFGGELPCPDNGLAQEPAADVRIKLVEICGEKWLEGAVCCDNAQVCYTHTCTVRIAS